MNVEGKVVAETDEKKGIAGTEYETPEELASALLKEREQRINLERKFGEQGSELGNLRKQTQTLAETLKEVMTSEKNKDNVKNNRQVNNEDDYSTQMSEIEKQITELDPADEKYQVKLAQLVQKSNRIQHEKTLSAASQIFKQELDERDIKSTQRAFLEANPTFNTPEIQTRIKDMMANDKTGILDPVAAFFQIQRDDAMLAARTASEQIAEITKRLELAEGKGKTGTVMIKGQSTVQKTSTPEKRLSGKEADEGALAVLEGISG